MISALYARFVIDTIPIFKFRLRKPSVLFALELFLFERCYVPDCQRIARRHTFITEKPVKEMNKNMKKWNSPLEKKKPYVNAAKTEVQGSSMDRQNTGSI